MKARNRKVLLLGFSVSLAAPFLVSALIVSAPLTALVDSLHGDILLTVLAVGGVVMSIVNGHTHIANVKHERDHGRPKSHTGPRSTSTFNLGY